MTHTRETKGTHVFEASDPAAAVTTLYVRKTALPGATPRSIVVKIEEVPA